jgi:LytS/YehU family sensor histidine kinase
MATSIKEMVEGLKEKAELEKLLHEEELALVSMGKALREAQFMNLQEQMKPHFLFNALNTIARSALWSMLPNRIVSLDWRLSCGDKKRFRRAFWLG